MSAGAGAASGRLAFDYSLSTSRCDASGMCSSGNCLEQEVSTSECIRNTHPNFKFGGMPVKMLIAQEMSKEVDSGVHQHNIVAKLMGLDVCALAEHESFVHPQIAASRCQGQQNRFSGDIDRNAFKDGHDIWKQTWKSSPCKGRRRGSESDERMMALVGKKFSEMKRLSADGNIRKSKQFEDAIEVSSSNDNTFLKRLQEPDTVSSEQQKDWWSVPPPEQRRITVLFPSRISNNHKCPNKDAIVNAVLSENISTGSSHSASLSNSENPLQPTRIVVLKPSHPKANGGISATSPHIELLKQPRDTRNQEPIEDAKIAGEQAYHGTLCRDEILTSYDKDGSFPSPFQTSYIDQLGSSSSSRSHSQTSYSPEVYQVAKKRLSIRWARASANGIYQDQGSAARSTKSLGELLALSEAKMASVPCETDGCYSEMEEPKRPVIHQEKNVVESPINLMRSKSVPAMPPKFGTELDLDISVMNNGMQHFYKDKASSKSVKSSVGGLISSLFPFKNKRSAMEKACNSGSNDEALSFHEKPCNTFESCRVKLPDQELYTKQRPSSESSFSLQNGDTSMMSHLDQHFLAKPSLSGGHRDDKNQPSLMSLTGSPFGDDCTGRDLPECLKPNHQSAKLSIDCRGSNVLGRSPAIGTIPRTISWDEPCRQTVTAHPAAERSSTTQIKNEELDWVLLAKALLTGSGLKDGGASNSYADRWYSVEAPLDPLLRDKYIDIQDKEMVPEAKRSHRRSTRNLVFDCVNAALLEIAGPRSDLGHCNLEKDLSVDSVSSPLGDRVLELLNSWFSRDARRMSDGCENSNTVAVEAVVKDEVVSGRWADQLIMEIEDMNKDITRTLLEDLVHEAVREMASSVEEEAVS